MQAEAALTDANAFGDRQGFSGADRSGRQCNRSRYPQAALPCMINRVRWRKGGRGSILEVNIPKGMQASGAYLQAIPEGSTNREDMMPSLNTFALVFWQVNWENGIPSVAPTDEAPTTLTLLLADGATSTDSQVIGQYLMSIQDQGQRQIATQAVADGLITVVPLQKANVVAPPVPPRLRAAGAPAAAAAAGAGRPERP